MFKNSSVKILGGVALSITIALSGCGASDNISATSTAPQQNAATRADAENSLSALNHAHTIELKKATFSIGDSWTVSADGTQVASIKGLAFKTFGDQYTVLSNGDGVMGSEDEQIMTLSQTANFYDGSGNKTGVLQKQYFSWMAKYVLTDNSNSPEATLEQVFSLGFSGDIKTSDGVAAWHFDKKIVAIGADILLTKTNDSKVTALDAVRMTVIANEIKAAQDKKNSNSNNNSNSNSNSKPNKKK